MSTRQMQSINGASLRVLNSMIERIGLDSSFERIAFKTFRIMKLRVKLTKCLHFYYIPL